ncbi:olfactory receptor 6N1-like [Pleuronectes platessa]|uniref:olfactory receptor 6N1-like n=1 Tax=Pleuronectes platessa TaxID=8262 RepID=UPI00232A3A71|nr:olfactory receptor 6N1-like [Pleuronectes platessa]
MENHTDPPYFILTMFVNLGSYRYPTFVLCFLLYAFIVSANLVIILAISQEKKLHEPMYIFIMCLSINSMYGSAGFFLRFLRDLLSDTHMISRMACYIQVYIIYSYASYELTILGIMAYDRYVAVCQPLHYHNKITLKVVSKLILASWVFPSIGVAVCAYLSFRLPLCGNKIPKVFCANWPLVKLSCVATLINNLVGMLWTSCTIFLPLAFVLFTYVKIFLVCRKRDLKFKGKVLQSCVPHIVTFVSYSITVFCDISLSRINVEELNPFLGVILSLEFVVIPPILNPLVYGLKLPEIRKTISRMLSCSKHDEKAKP